MYTKYICFRHFGPVNQRRESICDHYRLDINIKEKPGKAK